MLKEPESFTEGWFPDGPKSPAYPYIPALAQIPNQAVSGTW
jgi:hypothetical protein